VPNDDSVLNRSELMDYTSRPSFFDRPLGNVKSCIRAMHVMKKAVHCTQSVSVIVSSFLVGVFMRNLLSLLHAKFCCM